MKHIPSCSRSLLQALGAIVFILILSGWTFPASPTIQNTAFVRIIHASPDVGIVDVFVDGTKLLSSFQFATVTEYVPLPEGSHQIQIALLGKGVNAAMLAQTVTVQAATVYTIAVLGTKATGFSFSVFTDNNVIAGNLAKLRVYHLSLGTGTVNIDTNNQDIIQGLAYPQGSDYVTLPSGQHTFTLTGLPQQAPSTFSVTLKPWTVTSVFAIGQLDGSQKFQFVTAQVQGIPHMPATGSDPTPLPVVHTATTSPILWLVGLLIVVVMGTGAGCYRLALRRKSQEEGEHARF